MIVPVTINGKKLELEAEPKELLIDTLRRYGYFSVKKGCSEGSCGSCTILVDGRPMKSCIMFVGQVKDRELTTVEGLGTVENPHPLQEAFVDEAGIQCGFCIPGMLLAAEALLKKNLDPTEEDIKFALSGNLCRCTGYVKQIEAVKKAAKIIREEVKQ